MSIRHALPAGILCRRESMALGLLLCLGCLLGDRLLAQPVPLAPLPQSPLVARHYQVRQSRFHEAQTKARLFARLHKQEVDAPADLLTAGMMQYDALSYFLALNLDPDLEILSGTVTATVAVVDGPLSELELNLRQNLTVSAATVGDSAASFVHASHILTITLDRAYANGEQVTVSATYAGDPASRYFGWDSYGGEPLIWTLSEPYGARHWWPCKDLNTDKPDSVDIQVTVPEDLIVASNGVLIADIDNGATRTYHWQERYPIATYLVSLAVHPYATFSDWYQISPTDSMPLQYYVVPDRLTEAQTSYGVVPDMLAVFASGFGPYPFLTEKYGHAHFPWGGGMEHQTITSLHFDAYSETVISHELAHQWWGDMITCATFHHIWLNEGFATWSEAYWREQNEGTAAYHEEMGYAQYWGPGSIYVEDPDNFGAIFNWDLTYQKASWIVHMLRHVLGDDDFFAALLAYRATYEGGSATTEQLRDVCESVSGLDLDAFFQQWIYGEFYPQYTYGWYEFAAGDSIRLQLVIEQTQTNTGLFVMPLDVTVTTDHDSYDFVVQNFQALQSYSLMVSGAVQAVELDKDDWILKTATPTILDVPVAAARASLLPNFPNPFNPSTTIVYELPTAAVIRLEIFDVAGRHLRTLHSGRHDGGRHTAVWDGRDRSGDLVAAGTYFYRLQTPTVTHTRKMMLLK